MIIRNLIIVSLGLALSIVACKDQPDPESEIPWSLRLPSNFPQPHFDVVNRPFTEAGFALGRKIFYDPQLSRDNSTSCGSCHIQSSAFTQHGHAVSHGIDNQLGRRNSPPVQNMLWEPRFFWDGGVQNLELVPITAISSPVEMDEDPARVLDKLRNDPRYPPLFEAAYGSPEITSGKFLFALAQFMGSLVSADSKYDHVKRGENGAVFTTEEQRGYDLFKTHCVTCHTEPLFTDYSFRDNGLPKNYQRDGGRYEISLDSTDLGRFRVPSLRNLTFTKPYMHDGKIASLEAVLDHYAGNLQDSPNLDPVLRQADGSLGFRLSAQDKADLVAFLKTLDDQEFVRNPAFSEQ
jgi:cytochrome c peroxidase